MQATRGNGAPCSASLIRAILALFHVFERGRTVGDYYVRACHLDDWLPTYYGSPS